MKIKVVLEHNGIMPKKSHKQDAGYDLFTPVDFFVGAFQRYTIWTGVSIEMPENYFALIRSKNKLFKKFGIYCDGLIDGSSGQIGVTLMNTTNKKVMFNRGDKIAHMVFMKAEEVEFGR